MTPDQIYDYDLRIAEKKLGEDPKARPQDRKVIQAFMKRIRPQGISIGRQAKYVNLLHRCAQLIRVPFSKAKRQDIEDLVTRLADHEFVVRGPIGLDWAGSFTKFASI